MNNKSSVFRIRYFRHHGLVWVLCIICLYSLISSGTITQGQALNISAAHIAKIQAALQQLGYNPGPVDGVMGKRTTAAIRAFQTQLQVSVDGQPSPVLLDMLQGALAKQAEPASNSGGVPPAEAEPAAEGGSPAGNQASSEANPPTEGNLPAEGNPPAAEGGSPAGNQASSEANPPTEGNLPAGGNPPAAEGKPPTKPGPSTSTESGTSAPASGIGTGTMIIIGAGAVAALGGIASIVSGAGSDNSSNPDDDSSRIPGPLGGYCVLSDDNCYGDVLWRQNCIDDNGCAYFVFGNGRIINCLQEYGTCSSAGSCDYAAYFGCHRSY